MKQSTTKFEKSTPRQLAYLLLGVGLIGLALYEAGPEIGLDLGSTAAWIMFIGFVGAAIFMVILGGAPIPSGTEEVDLEDRVVVQMSDELQGDIKGKVDSALKDLVTGLTTKINSVQNTLDSANVGEIANQLSSLAKDIDVESTTEALTSLKTSINSVTSNLDELSNLSASETEKIEGSVSEIAENLEATKTELKNKIAELNQAMASVESELNQTRKQFEEFNSIG